MVLAAVDEVVAATVEVVDEEAAVDVVVVDDEECAAEQAAPANPAVSANAAPVATRRARDVLRS